MMVDRVVDDNYDVLSFCFERDISVFDAIEEIIETLYCKGKEESSRHLLLSLKGNDCMFLFSIIKELNRNDKFKYFKYQLVSFFNREELKSILDNKRREKIHLQVCLLLDSSIYKVSGIDSILQDMKMDNKAEIWYELIDDVNDSSFDFCNLIYYMERYRVPIQFKGNNVDKIEACKEFICEYLPNAPIIESISCEEVKKKKLVIHVN